MCSIGAICNIDLYMSEHPPHLTSHAELSLQIKPAARIPPNNFTQDLTLEYEQEITFTNLPKHKHTHAQNKPDFFKS